MRHNLKIAPQWANLQFDSFMTCTSITSLWLNPHYTPVLPVLFLSGGRHLLQDMFRNRGILGVLFSKITPVREHFVIRTGVILTVLFFKIPRFVNRGILGVLFSKLTPVRKLDHGVKVVICPSLEIARVVTLWPKRPILAAANVVWIKM